VVAWWLTIARRRIGGQVSLWRVRTERHSIGRRLAGSRHRLGKQAPPKRQPNAQTMN